MPFQPGQSGNPGGRTKGGHNLATELADLGKRRPGKRENPAHLSRMPRTRQLAYRLWSMALADPGNLDAAKYVTDRLLGRPAQEIKLDTQLPALVFQIIDPRLPVPELAQAPEQDQEAVEGEVVDRPAVFRPLVPDAVAQAASLDAEPGMYQDGVWSGVPDAGVPGDPDHQPPDVAEEGWP